MSIWISLGKKELSHRQKKLAIIAMFVYLAYLIYFVEN
jgi:hypothetical protein